MSIKTLSRKRIKLDVCTCSNKVRNFKDYLRSVYSAPSPPPSNPTSTTSSSSQLRSARIPLREGSTFGLSVTRGTRAYQEDTTSAACIWLPTKELRESYARSHSKISQEAARLWTDEKLSLPGMKQGQVDQVAGQIAWFGCFDGHGGQAISSYLQSTLHEIYETVTPSMVTDTIQFTRSQGGYFRRFTGGMLERWVRKELLTPVRAGGRGDRKPKSRETENGGTSSPEVQSLHRFAQETERTASGGETLQSSEADATSSAVPKDDSHKEPRVEKKIGPAINAGPAVTSKEAKEDEKREQKLKQKKREESVGLKLIDPPDGMEKESLTLAERATLAWLVADRQIQADPELDVGGSTASVVLLHSLDTPTLPWYSSRILSMTSIHVGDTRILLCPVSDGIATPLTSYHHPDDRAESERLRKMGAGMITDSFGEARWMGALANTRAFGDSHYKKLGVTAEPEVITQVLRGDDYAFVVLFSDGIGGVMSDQEVVDLCRGVEHPSEAAKNVLTFAEELGSEDNGTVVCIPLRGWGKVQGEDRTKERRNFRRSKVDLFRDGRN